MLFKSLFAALIALSFGVTACDSGDDAPPVEAADLVVTAEFDAAVATGQNRLRVTVKDDAGAAVTGATVTVDPQMPVHGHGSSEVPVVTEVGDGVYEAFPVTFTMGGPWVVTVDAMHGEREGELVMDVTVP